MQLAANLIPSPKAILTANLQAFVDGTREQLAKELSVIESEQLFLTSLSSIVESECPNYQEQFLAIQDHFLHYLNLSKSFSDAESRQIEDLNDITERFAVTCRISSERDRARTNLKDARAKLEKAREKLAHDEATGGANKFTLESNIKQATDQVRQAITDLKATINEFIAEKHKFNQFRQRRMKHSYSAFGDSTHKIMTQKSGVLRELISSIENLHGSLAEENPAVAAALPEQAKYVPEPIPVVAPTPPPAFTPQVVAPVFTPEPEVVRPVVNEYRPPPIDDNPFE
jgi:DNA repair exonuclease SbcCD ATPase subunit